MRRKPPYYEDIRGAARLIWQQLEGNPQLAGPWRQLFSQIQSPRHVISELLQNADDAGATSASVSIESGVFTFQHDGRDFTPGEFESLCRFGYSNKRNLHTIGFRGVGFKSTFSIGDCVEVRTPSIAVRFEKQRFTEPVWIENALPEDITTVRVETRDVHRNIELNKNIKEWGSSPASLLFFNNIKQLDLGGESVQLTHLGDGPIPFSSWQELQGAEERSKLLLIRSKEESFPDDAIDEIRKERFSEEVTFPPCSVEIVIGLPDFQRLFVVLPTGVRLGLPFSINGPFVQDPARMGIKDPAVSPTNRWLLDRVGRLAAKAMLTWLGNHELSIDERAAAYELLPSLADGGDALGDRITQAVCEAFDEEVNNEPCVLTSSGDLASVGSCFSPPRAIYKIWKPAEIISLFGDDEFSSLAYEFSDATRDRLSDRDWLKALSPGSLIDWLSCGHRPPRPEPLSALYHLWEFVHASIEYDWDGERRRRVSMVPVEGKDFLYSADLVVRLPTTRKTLSDNDWVFLSEYILALDNGWLELFADAPKIAPKLLDQQKLIKQILSDVGLGAATPADTIVSRASDAFFGRPEVEVDGCVRFAHIVAVLDAQLPDSFQYLARDGDLHNAADGVVIDIDGQIEEVLPSEWADNHLLHADYFAETETCKASRWLDWALSEKSLLKPFVPIQELAQQFRAEGDFTGFLLKRGGACPDQKYYRYGYFQVTDYDFDPKLVRLWKSTAKASSTIWASVLKKVMAGGEAAWRGKISIDAKNVQRNNGLTKSVHMAPIVAAWIARFQKTPCLPDTFGAIREPAELLLRSPDTEPLMGVESFVDSELDTPETKPLLKLLGVRDTPAGPMPVIRRIAALAESTTPPIHELARWYEALDRILARSRRTDLDEAQETFQGERLIFTQQGEWVTAGEAFLAGGDLDISDLPVVHESVARLSMWRRIGVADQPSVERFLEWLHGLDTNRRLDGQELRRVRAITQRYPVQVWESCGHWLNLDGLWIDHNQLDHALRDDGGLRVRELFPNIKRRTADLRNLLGASHHLPIFANLADLGLAIHYRITDKQSMLPPRIRKPWLFAVGECLRRLRLDDPTQTSIVFDAATRLMNTIWQPFRVLRVTPYLDGTPAGQSHSPLVLWDGGTLFVREGSLATIIDTLVDEIGRHFGNDRIRDALRVCVERDEQFVTEYLRERFELQDAPIEEEGRALAQQSQRDPGVAGGVPIGNNPETGTETLDDVETGESPSDFNDEDIEAPADVDDADPDDTEPMRQTRERGPRDEPQPTLISRFAKQCGFRWSNTQEAYVHANGCRIHEVKGMFPWEKLDSSGTVLAKYWLAEQRLTNGIDIGADIWQIVEDSPEIHKLLVLDDGGEPLVVSGTQLVEDLKNEKFRLFPLKYRLKPLKA